MLLDRYYEGTSFDRVPTVRCSWLHIEWLLTYSCDGRIRPKGARNGHEDCPSDIAKAGDVRLTISSRVFSIGFQPRFLGARDHGWAVSQDGIYASAWDEKEVIET